MTDPDNPRDPFGTDRRTAQGFRYDPDMERLARLRDTDPAGFRALGPRIALSVGTYEMFREAAQRHGLHGRPAADPVPPAGTLAHAIHHDLKRAGHIPDDPAATDKPRESFYA